MAIVDLINQFSADQIGQTTKPAQSLGKDDFLKLLVMQLKNQDPLEPMKNEQFVAQLAQFNSLEQMINLNKSFESMFGLQQLSYASSFIGKLVAYADADGNPQTGLVQEVGLDKGKPMLNLGNGVLISPDDVVAVAQAPAA